MSTWIFILDPTENFFYPKLVERQFIFAIFDVHT